ATFSKAKAQYPWPALTRRGLIRVIFYPFFYRWWYQQLSLWLFVSLLCLYCLQIISIIVYFKDDTTDTDLEVISLTEVFGPAVLMILLGTVHSQVVSTNFARPLTSPRIKKRRKLRRKSFAKRNTSSSRNSNESTNLDSSLEGNSKKFYSEGRKKVFGKWRSSRKSEKSESEEDGNQEIIEEKIASSDNAEAVKKQGVKNVDKSTDVTYMRNEDDEEAVSGRTTEDVSALNTPIEDLGIDGEIILASQDEFGPGNSETYPAAAVAETINVDEELNKRIAKSFEASEVNKPMPAKIVTESAEENKEYIVLEGEQVTSNIGTTGLRKRVKDGKSGKPVADKAYIPREMEDEEDDEEVSKINEDGNVKLLRVPPYQKVHTGYSSEESDIETNPSGTPCPERDSLFIPKRDSDLEDPSWTETVGVASESESESATEETDNDNGELEFEEEDVREDQDGHPIPIVINSSYTVTDRVTVRVWEHNECKKADLSMLEISNLILNKVYNTRFNMDYLFFGFLFAFFIAVLPVTHRLNGLKPSQLTIHVVSVSWLMELLRGMFGTTWRIQLIVIVSSLLRFVLSGMFFFLLAVTERTYRQRFLLAKYFGHVTSARKARKSDIPHFRLNKVRNIKTWLSLRSYLKRRGPQRSIDVIVSSAFLLALSLVSLLCVQLLRDSGTFLTNLYNWELVAWCLILGVYLLRFMTLGTKINKKYKHQNTSALLTEQINLYLHMEQKPHKKEELMLANHVLSLAVKLLNELESPFKISGLAMNPVLYNITRVVVLSAFSGVMTEMLGFKLKLWKVGL
ncbi:protein PHTF2-like, partial [Saccoglossus kowalevskii]